MEWTNRSHLASCICWTLNCSAVVRYDTSTKSAWPERWYRKHVRTDLNPYLNPYPYPSSRTLPWTRKFHLDQWSCWPKAATSGQQCGPIQKPESLEINWIVYAPHFTAAWNDPSQCPEFTFEVDCWLFAAGCCLLVDASCYYLGSLTNYGYQAFHWCSDCWVTMSFQKRSHRDY